jgi:Tfp pilus assembly protein PilF
MKSYRLIVTTLAALTFACGGGAGKGPASQASGTPPAESGPSREGPVAAPSSPEVGEGIKSFQGGDLEAAKAHFEAAVKVHPNDGDALYYLGMVAEKTNDKKTAEEKYTEALKNKPELENAAVNLGALYIEAQKVQEALMVTRQGLAKNPKTPGLHLNLAVALAMKGDVAGSQRAFEEAAKLAPNEPLYEVTYAHWLGVWKHPEDAQSKLRAARPLAEKNVEMLGLIAKEMHLVGAAVDCVPTLDKAIALQDAAELRYLRGLCKVSLKDDPGAIADFQAAIAKEPKEAEPHYWLAGRYAAAEKWKDVVAEYETYLKLAPDGPLARQAHERVKLAKQKAGGAAGTAAAASTKKGADKGDKSEKSKAAGKSEPAPATPKK